MIAATFSAGDVIAVVVYGTTILGVMLRLAWYASKMAATQNDHTKRLKVLEDTLLEGRQKGRQTKQLLERAKSVTTLDTENITLP